MSGGETIGWQIFLTSTDTSADPPPNHHHHLCHPCLWVPVHREE